MYEIGKNRLPAPKTSVVPNRSSWQVLAGPIRFEHSSTVTKAAITRS